VLGLSPSLLIFFLWRVADVFVLQWLGETCAGPLLHSKARGKHRVDALGYCGINLVSLCARSDWTKMLPVMQERCISSVPD
jgi:hypothetical protein